VTQRKSDLESLLGYLKRARGFDFTGYKRNSLERRIRKRMQSIKVLSFDDYVDYLEVHPEEFSALFNTILINVTSFFRDAPTWEYVAETVIPDVIARREASSPIRIWSAGCASGEEAYTLAMLFAEALDPDEFKQGVKIYATDVDEEALARARHAVYNEREVADVPRPLLEKYFEISNGSQTFRKDLRHNVIFGRHDLIQDAPISRVDMLVCRNTLMYFNAETQARIIARFQFALNDHGVLFLGRAETLMTHSNTFIPLDLKRRISAKLPRQRATLRDRLLALANPGGNGDPGNGHELRLREVAFEAITTAQLVVDVAGTLVLANERARALFGMSLQDVGRPLQDLKISYRPVELRSSIDQAYADRRPVVLRDIESPALSGELRWLDVHVVPLVDPTSFETLGASVAFNDVSTAKRLQRDLEEANQKLETAYEELQSTNEELETTNEELQSTVEELETTNEELQSTNEELETMNEELQSTNEELQTMNDELRQRSDELNQVNGFLESILTSMRGAVVVVDPEIKVLVWNQGAEELWGVREDEARGKHLLGLDIGLPVDELKAPVRACLSGLKEHVSLTVKAVNRRGKSILCQVTVTPLRNRTKTVHGVILITEEILKTISKNGAKQRGAKEAAA